MERYYHKIEIEWGCGCSATNCMPIVEGEEPSARTAFVSLIDTLTEPGVAAMGLEDEHEDGGGESITVTVRTKVGVPE